MMASETAVKGFEGDVDDDYEGREELRGRKWYGAGFWNTRGVEIGIYKPLT